MASFESDSGSITPTQLSPEDCTRAIDQPHPTRAIDQPHPPLSPQSAQRSDARTLSAVIDTILGFTTPAPNNSIRRPAFAPHSAEGYSVVVRLFSDGFTVTDKRHEGRAPAASRGDVATLA